MNRSFKALDAKTMTRVVGGGPAYLGWSSRQFGRAIHIADGSAVMAGELTLKSAKAKNPFWTTVFGISTIGYVGAGAFFRGANWLAGN